MGDILRTLSPFVRNSGIAFRPGERTHCQAGAVPSLSVAAELETSSDEVVARAFSTLTATRLRILRALKAGQAPGRAAQEDIDRLLDAGVLTATNRHSPGDVHINPQTLFTLSEVLRSLAGPAPDTADASVPSGSPAPIPSSPRPCFVLVKGVGEGRVFDLRSAAAPNGFWIVGRRRSVAVALDYDPYVSSENCVLHWDGQRHVLSDAVNSRNGTTLNLKPLRSGEAAPLAHGDLVGVGQSLLLYLS